MAILLSRRCNANTTLSRKFFRDIHWISVERLVKMRWLSVSSHVAVAVSADLSPFVCTLFPFVGKVRCTGGVMDLAKMEWNGMGRMPVGICLVRTRLRKFFKPFSSGLIYDPGYRSRPRVWLTFLNIYNVRRNGNFHYLNAVKLFITIC